MLRGIAQKEWYILSIVFCLINALISPLVQYIKTNGIQDTIINFGEISVIIWFSIVVSFHLIHKAPALNLNIKDKLLCCICITLCFIPSAMICWGSLGLLCAYLLIRSKNEIILFNGLIIMLMIALRIPLVQFCSSVFSESILNFDAYLVAEFLSIFNPLSVAQGNIVHTGKGYSLAIMTGCSAFDNMSLAILLWFTLVKITNYQSMYIPLHHALIVAIGVIVINTIRLALMATYYDFYTFFHDENGLIMIELFILMMAFIVAGYTRKGLVKNV